jgi:DNA polymerase III subunit beta
MLSLARKDLATAIDVVRRVATTKSTMPTLAKVHLSIDGARLRATCTDLYTTASVAVPCEGSAPVDHAVDVRALCDRLKRFRNGHLDVHAPANDSADRLAFVEGSRRYELPWIPGEDFPPCPDMAGARTLFTCDAGLLAHAIDAVLFAASTDETRAHLNAVQWEVSESDVLRLVATDGHRCAVHDEPLPTKSVERGMTTLLSLSSMKHLRGLLGGRKPSGEVSVIHGRKGESDVGTLHVARGDLSFWARCVEATFPAYGQIMPEVSRMARHATCDRAELSDALRAVSVASSERTGAVVLTFERERIVCTAESPENGKAVEVVRAHRVSRDAAGASDVRIGYNAKYLIDALDAGEGQYACLSTSGELDPMRLAASTGTANVIMPMRI